MEGDDDMSDLDYDAEALSRRVRMLRERNYWSVGYLAGNAGISVTTVYAIENGYGSMRRTLEKVATAFGMSLNELLYAGMEFDLSDDEHALITACRAQDMTEAVRVLARIVGTYE